MFFILRSGDMFGNDGIRFGWGVWLGVLLFSFGCEGLREEMAGKGRGEMILSFGCWVLDFG